MTCILFPRFDHHFCAGWEEGRGVATQTRATQPGVPRQQLSRSPRQARDSHLLSQISWRPWVFGCLEPASMLIVSHPGRQLSRRRWEVRRMTVCPLPSSLSIAFYKTQGFLRWSCWKAGRHLPGRSSLHVPGTGLAESCWEGTAGQSRGWEAAQAASAPASPRESYP